MASNLRVLITTGDVDGIGWEVTAKALQSLGPKPGVQFFYFRQARHANLKPARPAKFRHKLVATLTEASRVPFDPRTLVEIRSSRGPARWVQDAAEACMRGEFHALVTAPLSKTTIVDEGFQDIGHTEILARVSGVRDLFMGFVGSKFSVVLATGHTSVKNAVTSFSPEILRKALKAAAQLRATLPPAKRKRPLALVGVNPHAGERGLIGHEEKWMIDVLQEEVENYGELAGPLVPDAAFLQNNWPLFSAYVCPYHDQGLIPFKLVHGFKGGVHLTLGLPFVRTSVDHGTAKELFGKNRAEAGSMRDAIIYAIRLAKEI